MESTLSQSRRLFSQEAVQKAIRSDLSYSECREFDTIFQTNYCWNYLFNLPGIKNMNSDLQKIMINLLMNSVPITFDLVRLLGGYSIHASSTPSESMLPDLIQEIMGNYYLTSDGKVYSSNNSRPAFNQLVPTNPPNQKMVKIVQYRAFTENGKVYYFDSGYGAQPNQPLATLVELNQVPYPSKFFLITSSGFITPSLPSYLGKNGEFGPISVPGAIKVLLDENPKIIAFLKEDKSVVFYSYYQFQPDYDQPIVPISVDSTKNIADLGFIRSRLVGLTSGGKLVEWNENFQQQDYIVPSRLGRIIRLGNGLVVNEYGLLYYVTLTEGGLIWITVSHNYQIAQITNKSIDNDAMVRTTGKLANLGNFAEDVNYTVLTTDLYGNELVTYNYRGIQKGWIGPKDRHYDPVNVTGRSRILNYNGELLKGAIRFGILYDPGVLDSEDPEINQVYIVLPRGTVEIMKARVRDGQILD